MITEVVKDLKTLRAGSNGCFAFRPGFKTGILLWFQKYLKILKTSGR